jgi:hypothetical protein
MTRASRTWMGLAVGLAVAAVAGGGCSSSSSPADGGGGAGAGGKGGAGGAAGGTGGAGGAGGAAQTLYQKYGAAGIAQVVSDAANGLLADCEISPYFAVVGTAGHDSAARLESCLRLQFHALFGDPAATYPGVNDEGDTCVSMTAIHAGLDLPSDAFDRFMVDFGGVLAADGITTADITTIAAAVTSLKPMIVSSTPVEKPSVCDAGAGQ